MNRIFLLKAIIKCFIIYNNYLFLSCWSVPKTDFIVIEPNIVYRWCNITYRRINFYYFCLKMILNRIKNINSLKK